MKLYALWFILLCYIVWCGERLIRAVREEGAQTRQLLSNVIKAVSESSDYYPGSPTLADRLKWIQWKINPKGPD